MPALYLHRVSFELHLLGIDVNFKLQCVFYSRAFHYITKLSSFFFLALFWFHGRRKERKGQEKVSCFLE